MKNLTLTGLMAASALALLSSTAAFGQTTSATGSVTAGGTSGTTSTTTSSTTTSTTAGTTTGTATTVTGTTTGATAGTTTAGGTGSFVPGRRLGSGQTSSPYGYAGRNSHSGIVTAAGGPAGQSHHHHHHEHHDEGGQHGEHRGYAHAEYQAHHPATSGIVTAAGTTVGTGSGYVSRPAATSTPAAASGGIVTASGATSGSSFPGKGDSGGHHQEHGHFH